MNLMQLFVAMPAALFTLGNGVAIAGQTVDEGASGGGTYMYEGLTDTLFGGTYEGPVGTALGGTNMI